jgi:hypothetical protein
MPNLFGGKSEGDGMRHIVPPISKRLWRIAAAVKWIILFNLAAVDTK